MNIEVTPIPEQVDRLSDMTRFYETVQTPKKSTVIQSSIDYIICTETTNKVLSNWIFTFQNIESKWLTYSWWEITVWKSWLYYVWWMINIVQQQLSWDPTWLSASFSCLWEISTSDIVADWISTIWYSTVWNSRIIYLQKDAKISITMTIWGRCSSIWPSNRIYLFELHPKHIS